MVHTNELSYLLYLKTVFSFLYGSPEQDSGLPTDNE